MSAKMKLLLAALVATPLFERIEAPELPLDDAGQVRKLRVAVMSGAERDRFDMAWRDARAKDGDRASGFRAMLAVFTLRDDEQGERIYDDGDIGSANLLPAPLLDRILDVAMRINGLAAKAVEQAEKNS